ncbi:MAG: hypothetical protein WC717_03050 [Candidatus Micrarchaeia archaeon]|jgi:hypothetical protein
MGAKTELFPTFAELCAMAREVEKKAVSVPPRPIDGKLVLDENFGIFPREFDEYTYSFLLFEAQKIERWLSTEAIISSSRQEAPEEEPGLSPKKSVEAELRKFVSAQEQALPEREESAILPPNARKIPGGQGEEASAVPQGIPLAKEEAAAAPREGKDAGLPAPEEVAAPPAARPRVLPQKTPAWQGTPPIAPTIPAATPAPRQQEAMPSAGGEGQAAPASEAGKKPPAGISSYSKLSPRLQALIEQKLRREEAKANRTREDQGIFKTPPVPPQEEEEPEAPAPPPVPEEEDGGKEMPGVPLARGEGEPRRAMKKGKLLLRKPAEIEAEVPPLPVEEEPPAPVQRKSAPRLPVLEDEMEAPAEEGGEEAEGEKEEPAEGEGHLESPLPDEEEKQAPAPVSEEKEPIAREDAPQGPLLIKPLFPDAAPPGAPRARPASLQAEDSDRMRRIQRIISELSPDRARAQATQESASFEKAEEPEDEEPAPKEEAAPARAKAMGKKAKAAGAALMKKAAKAAKKKGKALQKEAPEQQSRALPPATPALLPLQPPAARPMSLLRRPPAEKGAASQPRNIVPEEKGEEPALAIRKMAPRMPIQGKDEEGPARAPRKLAPRIPVREDAAEDDEGQMPSQAPKKLALRLPAREEETEDDEAQAPATAPRKPAPGIPVREEEEVPAQPPGRLVPRIPAREEAPRKLAPRIPVREEEEENEEPALPSRRLVPRIPAREEEEDGQEEPPAQAPSMKRRIFPGMGRAIPPAPQTYVPPARSARQLQAAREGEEEAAPEQEMPGLEGPEAREPEEEAAAPAQGQRKMPMGFAPLRPKKLVSDEEGPSEKTPEQVAQDQKMARMAEQLARLEAGKVKEVAGTAALPEEEEDVPLPPESEAAPKPPDYGQAKESLRRSLEHVETARKVKQGEESMVEQYAKDHLVWLYEIYKMGGMGREDFLAKAAEKYSEAQGEGKPAAAQPAEDAPPNPALANLTKVIEKKDKK